MSSEKPIEAEVVEPSPTQAVAVRQAGSVATQTVQELEQAFALAVRQRELLSDYIKKQLVPGKHFYARGDQKPSLTKEGAEIILLPHSLAPDYEIIGGPQEPPKDDSPYQITVKCTLRPKGNPTAFVGAGIGSAGSHKGYWKRQKSKPDEWDYQPRQTDKYLCYNATVKMAQKSAMIAATINSTAASEFFTQDMEPGSEPDRPQERPATKRAATPSKTEKVWTASDYLKRFCELVDEAKKREMAMQFFIDLGWLLPQTETLESLPDNKVPHTKEEMELFWKAMAVFAEKGIVSAPYPIRREPGEKPIEVPRGTTKEPEEEGDEEWRSFPVLYGESAGTPLGDLEKKTLWGWWNNFEVTTEYKGKPKKPETIAKERKFREMLDQAGEHYQFEKKD